MSQVEFLHVITRTTLNVEVKERLHGSGTTRGDMLGPVEVPSSDSMWQAPHATKKKLYGTGRVECGGAVAGDCDKDDPPKAKEQVPFCYHSRSPKVYEEIGHAFDAACFLDLTCCDGVLPISCVRKHKPYLGVCFTDAHRAALKEQIISEMFKCFQREDDSLYQPELANFLADKLGKEDDKQKRKGLSGEPDKGKKPKAVAKSKAGTGKPETKNGTPGQAPRVRRQ